MVHVSHEIWGLGIVALLIGLLTLKAVYRRIKTGRTNTAKVNAESDSAANQDFEHRALMYLMAQTTDSLLGALAKTIAQERQKLGGVVRNPSMEEALERLQAAPVPAKKNRASNYDAVYPLLQQGMDAETIARRLRFPEEEIALVKRLQAA